jgi:hypothetical protein
MTDEPYITDGKAEISTKISDVYDYGPHFYHWMNYWSKYAHCDMGLDHFVLPDGTIEFRVQGKLLSELPGGSN